MKKTIGGNRLGAGKKMTVDLKTYNRSTHDLSYIWRSTMASGTLVPYLTEVGLPGDTFDIDLDCVVKTHPTIGPLFGSYKVQLDVFMIPIRLYIASLHNNALGIGNNMANVKLPQLEIEADALDPDYNLDNQQINPSSILSYLNIRGVGRQTLGETVITRQFNAVPYLGYWDIYKNYYANKQEGIGAVIHGGGQATIDQDVTGVTYNQITGSTNVPQQGAGSPITVEIVPTGSLRLYYVGVAPTANTIVIMTSLGSFTGAQIWANSYLETDGTLFWVTLSNQNAGDWGIMNFWRYATAQDLPVTTPEVVTFDLDNIDNMRNNILAQSGASAFIIDNLTTAPYGLVLGTGTDRRYATLTQEGLGLKTYQSDLFNNWMETEWIDGANGIAEVTAVDTTGGSFTMDTLNLARKVYDMLNRIAISGGTYNDWVETVYTHEGYRGIETPMYMGGLSKELVFQEVVSNSQATGEDGQQPLGTLAGKGVMGDRKKGGKITVKVDEPCYIMGIISLTPRLDYSQGNKWDVNLKTMDDFHKPALDEIGFQDLVTEQMVSWDTLNVPGGSGNPATQSYTSAGKQPAWINYMTNVNQVRGNFAISDNEMFMTLNRRYEANTDDANPANWYIEDLTTYIDPIKFNHIFAQTSRDAQNFWVQIACDITARRKMSAKVMPNI